MILSTEGHTVRIPCPCRTDVGSFSKTDEKGTIWSNGIIAKDKKHNYSFTDGVLIIRQATSNDSGTYTWVCDEDYKETEVRLIVKGELHLIARIFISPACDIICMCFMIFSLSSFLHSSIHHSTPGSW